MLSFLQVIGSLSVVSKCRILCRCHWAVSNFEICSLLGFFAA